MSVSDTSSDIASISILLSLARSKTLPPEDISHLEAIAFPGATLTFDDYDFLSAMQARAESSGNLSYELGGISYTPSALKDRLTLLANAGLGTPQDIKTLRSAARKLSTGELLPLVSLPSLFETTEKVKEKIIESGSGTIFHRLYFAHSQTVERIIRLANGLSNDHSVMGTDVQHLYSTYFDRATGAFNPLFEARLPMRSGNGEYRRAITQLTDFFRQIDPRKHEIAGIGYARVKP